MLENPIFTIGGWIFAGFFFSRCFSLRGMSNSNGLNFTLFTPGGWSPWSCQTPMACCHVFRPFLCCWMPRSIPPSHDQGRWGSRSGVEASPFHLFVTQKGIREGIKMNQKKRNRLIFSIQMFNYVTLQLNTTLGPTIFMLVFFLDMSKSKAFHLWNLHEGIERWVYEAGAPWGFPHLCQ